MTSAGRGGGGEGLGGGAVFAATRCTAGMRPTAPNAQLLLVLVGIPGSGKSTFASSLLSSPLLLKSAAAATRPWRRVSQDVLGSRGKCIRAATRALSAGEHVLIDRCNFDREQRAHWLGLQAEQPPSHRVAVYLPVPPAEARRRVLTRGAHEGGVDANSMGEDKISQIVRRMHGSLTLPAADEGFDEIYVVGPPPEGLPPDDVIGRISALALS